MVTVVNYSVAQNAKGESFISLTIHGDLEMVLSKESGRFYATVKKTKIPCTLGESEAKMIIGQKLPGSIQKVPCEPYEYTNPETGEVIQMTHRYEYNPAEKGLAQHTSKVSPLLNGQAMTAA